LDWIGLDWKERERKKKRRINIHALTHIYIHPCCFLYFDGTERNVKRREEKKKKNIMIDEN